MQTLDIGQSFQIGRFGRFLVLICVIAVADNRVRLHLCGTHFFGPSKQLHPGSSDPTHRKHSHALLMMT